LKLVQNFYYNIECEFFNLRLSTLYIYVVVVLAYRNLVGSLMFVTTATFVFIIIITNNVNIDD